MGKWPTSGYLTPAVSGIPTAAERGDTSPLPYRGSPPLQSGGIVAHLTPAVSGIPTVAPQVGNVATSPLPYRGSPPLQSGGIKSEVAHKWASGPYRGLATSGSTPAVSGIPTASERGDKIRSGPQVGPKLATSPLPYRGSPPLQSGGIKSEVAPGQMATTSGRNGYLTPAVSGIPTAAERGDKIRRWPTSGRNGYLTPAVAILTPAVSEPHRCRAGG